MQGNMHPVEHLVRRPPLTVRGIERMRVNTLTLQCIQHGVAALERNLALSGTTAQENSNFPEIMVLTMLIFLARIMSREIGSPLCSLTAPIIRTSCTNSTPVCSFTVLRTCLLPLRIRRHGSAGIYDKVCVGRRNHRTAERKPFSPQIRSAERPSPPAGYGTPSRHW